MPDNDNPFEKHIGEDLDMDGVDGITCHIVHPLVIKALEVADEGSMTFWEKELTDLQRQIRGCMTTELLKEFLQNIGKPAIQFGEDGPIIMPLDLEDIEILMVNVISLAWLVLPQIEKQWEAKS